MKNSNIVYYVNEEKRVVVAKLFNVREEILNQFNKTFYRKTKISVPIDKVFKKIPETITCKAVCMPSDNFSVKKGKEIALAKLVQKIYHYKRMVITDMTFQIEDLLLRLEVLDDFCRSRSNYYQYILNNYTKIDEGE